MAELSGTSNSSRREVMVGVVGIEPPADMSRKDKDD